MTTWLIATGIIFLVLCLLIGIFGLSAYAVAQWDDGSRTTGLVAAVVAVLLFSGGFGMIFAMSSFNLNTPLCLRGHEEYRTNFVKNVQTISRVWVCEERVED